MVDRSMVYNIIYALAAKDGREKALFGDSAPHAITAFEHSLAGSGFPELWFEIPLTGEPWFDLHVLTESKDAEPGMAFSPEMCGGNPKVFEWFAAQKGAVRQLALSWDTGSGDSSTPAVQLLVSGPDPQVTCDFLAVAGRLDAMAAYRAFRDRLPAGWFACYTGTFPARPKHNLRVECIPGHDLQQAYANDASLLAEHLKQVGLQDLGDTLVPRCQELARTPFHIEFQFDVDERGYADTTFGASLRFAAPPGDGEWRPFDPDGEAGELMRRIEEWGLADSRWRPLADTAYATRVAHGGHSALLYCYPAFVKLRWRKASPLDAKAYIIAGVDE